MESITALRIATRELVILGEFEHEAARRAERNARFGREPSAYDAEVAERRDELQQAIATLTALREVLEERNEFEKRSMDAAVGDHLAGYPRCKVCQGPHHGPIHSAQEYAAVEA